MITSNTGNHLVQIMPVSFRNEKGLPETINVVITVPQGDADKKDLTATIATPLRAVVQQPTTKYVMITVSCKSCFSMFYERAIPR